MRLKLLVVIVLLFAVCKSKAAVWLPPIFSDHMVLQGNAPVKIWGNASPGEQVTLKILDQTVVVKTNAAGKWIAMLKPMVSAGPVSMTVSATNTITINDILIGEVWLASGQSNMEWKVKQSNNYSTEAAGANYPQIRLFRVKNGFADTVAAYVQGKWEICSPETVGNYTAVGYFFVRNMYLHNKIPTGLIEADWGATNCQAWTPLAEIEANPQCHYIIDNWKKVTDGYPAALQRYQAALDKWKKNAEEKKGKGDSVGAPRMPPSPKSKVEPGSIYNVVIAPLAGYTIKGVIWYQGEANAYQDVAYPYRYLFPTMIKAWRKAWGQGDFPFMFVQLSGMSAHPYWPVLRESQTETLKLPNTGMVVSIDLGDSTNAHYTNKQDVGYRMHLVARSLVYGEKIEYSGPVYKKSAIEKESMRIWFDHATGLKIKTGATLNGFKIAGEDGRFVPAEAKIDGETIVVTNSSITKPAAVRYAFVDWPYPQVNLVNGAGLPAVPFRTDDLEIK